MSLCMREPKFSVIVPIYNVERYLEECVKSIQAQSLKNIEIVLVDDGSPDHCGEIADKLASADERITVVHRQNGGLGPARNSGVLASSGEYVGFVDADDWVDIPMYEALSHALDSSGADICYSGIRQVSNGITVAETKNAFGKRVLVGSDEIFELRRSFYGDSIARVRDDGIPVSVCVAGYRRAMLLENDVKFEAIRSEDILFNIKAAAHASSVAVLDKVFYNYRQDRQTSITKAFKEGTFAEFEQFFEKLIGYAETEDIPYRQECLARSKRRIIDYARALGMIIESSNIDYKTKKELLKRSSSLERVRWALKGFPIWKLSLKQALYGFGLAAKNTHLLSLLLNLRGRSI